MIQDTIAEKFFDDYRRALLNRDASALAGYYAVPALIEFPDQRILVTDASQTEEFLAGAFGQYEGVSRADAAVKVLAQTGHSPGPMSPGATTAMRPRSATRISSSAPQATGRSPS